jgi:hypothetical protein
MEYKRISEIENYEGDKNGFLSLNDAIWRNAVDEEYKHQKSRLLMELSERFFPALLKYDRDSRRSYVKIQAIVGSKYGAVGLETMNKLEIEIEEHSYILKKSVQSKVHRETFKWPDNPRGKKDVKFEKEYKHIKQSILASLVQTGAKEA